MNPIRILQYGRITSYNVCYTKLLRRRRAGAALSWADTRQSAVVLQFAPEDGRIQALFAGQRTAVGRRCAVGRLLQQDGLATALVIGVDLDVLGDAVGRDDDGLEVEVVVDVGRRLV